METSLRPVAQEAVGLTRIATRLGTQEFRRRMWHFLPGMIAFALTPIPHRDPIPLPVMMVVVSLGILTPAYFAIRYHAAYSRHSQEHWLPALIGYVLPLTFLSLFFRAHTEIPLTVAAIIAFGDGSATLVGKLRGGASVPWNRGKSWIGLLAFIAIATPLATSIYWLEASPHIPLAMVFRGVASVVGICAIVETLPLKVNDNISVGLTAALLMLIMQTLVVGWL